MLNEAGKESKGKLAGVHQQHFTGCHPEQALNEFGNFTSERTVFVSDDCEIWWQTIPEAAVKEQRCPRGGGELSLFMCFLSMFF